MTDAADVNLELNPGNTTVRMKKPKRVLHFSDGVLEEYSDSETDEQPTETDTTIATVGFDVSLTDGVAVAWFVSRRLRIGVRGCG